MTLASAPLMTRYLGVADFGRYVTVTSLITIVGLFADAGLTTVGVREYAVQEPASRRRLMQNILAVRLVVAAVGALAAVAFAVLAGYGRTLVIGTALGGVGLILTMVQHTYAIPLTAQLRLGVATALDLFRQALTVAAIIALVLAGAELLLFFAIPIPIGVVVLLVTGLAIRHSMALTPRLEPSEWRYLLKETLPAAAASTLGSMFYRVAIIMMSLIATADAIGYFSASFRVVEAIVAVPSLLVGSAYPVLSRAAATDEGRLSYAVQRLFEIAVILGALTALSVAFASGVLIQVLAGPDFAPAEPVLRIQSLALAATFFVALWGGTLWVVRERRALVVGNLAGVISAIALTALLVPIADAEGAAIAMTCSEVLLALWLGTSLLRRHPALRPSVGIVPKTITALTVGGVVGLAALQLWEPLGVVAAAGVYLITMAGLRGIPPEIWETLGRRRSPAR